MSAITRSILLNNVPTEASIMGSRAGGKKKKKSKVDPMDRAQNPQRKEDLATLAGGKGLMPSQKDLLPESDPNAKKRFWQSF